MMWMSPWDFLMVSLALTIIIGLKPESAKAIKLMDFAQVFIYFDTCFNTK